MSFPFERDRDIKTKTQILPKYKAPLLIEKKTWKKKTLKHNQIDTVLDLDGNRHGIGVNEKIQYGPLNGLTKTKVDQQM